MVINRASLHQEGPITRMEYHKIYELGVSYGMSEAGYDIRIKQEVSFTRDFFLRRVVDRFELDERGITSDHERFPGRFVLASAIEHFRIPTDLMGIVHDKSTWARRGLSVFNTVIEPGWQGYLTLELVFHGWGDLVIPAGSGIAQVVFHKVSDPVAYKGRYQDQADKPVPAISSNQYELSV